MQNECYRRNVYINPQGFEHNWIYFQAMYALCFSLSTFGCSQHLLPWKATTPVPASQRVGNTGECNLHMHSADCDSEIMAVSSVVSEIPS